MMRMDLRSLARCTLLGLATAVLAACGGGGADSQDSVADAPPPDAPTDEAPETPVDRVSAVSGPDCGEAGCDAVGAFTAPFSEPTITGEIPDQDNTTIDNPIRNLPDDGRCIENDEGVRTCKPAAGSIALLGDGRLLYFNALEGTENVEYSIFFEAGHSIINDQTRVMTLGQPSADEAFWRDPTPVDGGANPDGNDSEVVLPVGGTADERTNNDGALFCADLTHLPDGRIMAVGGTDYYAEPGVNVGPIQFGVAELEGLRNARIFDPADNTWRRTGDMAFGRWYPTTVSLPDGDVFVASGVTKLVKPVYPERPIQSGRNVVNTETYDLGCETWADNGPLAQRSLPLYPRLHLLPNGHIYYNAAGQSFNPFGEAYDQSLWNIVAAYDPQAGLWTDLAYAGLPLRLNEAGLGRLTTGLNPANPQAADALATALTGAAGAISDDPAALVAPLIDDPDPQAAVIQAIGAGFRGSTFSVMMPLTPDADGQYTQAEFLTAGGVFGAVALPSPGSYVTTDLSRIDTVDITDDGLDYSSRVTGSLGQPRWYGQGVLLPTGQVMLFSGANRDEVVGPGTAQPILQTELFDPQTETWTDMAVQNRPRTYHNTALLLPDGRILVGGHAPINTAYAYSVTLPGFSPNDGRDPSFEIYSPPYMFGPRPSIAGAPASVDIGQTFSVNTPDAADIDSVVLVRRTDLTHLVDADQRNVELAITSRTADSLTVAMPDQPAVLPPGQYMLFVNAPAGDGLAPSESVSVAVTGGDFTCSS